MIQNEHLSMKRILVMPDLCEILVRTCGVVDDNDIETSLVVDKVVDLHETLGDAPYLAALLLVDGVLREPVCVGAASLYFDKDPDSAVAHHKIDLARSTKMKVPMHKAISLAQKIIERNTFVVAPIGASVECSFHCRW